MKNFITRKSYKILSAVFTLSFTVFMAAIIGCSDSDVSNGEMMPLHYSQESPDLIDVCRFDALESAADKENFTLVKAVGSAGETLGAALSKDSRTRVLLKGVAATGAKQLYTDNWLTKVAGSTGITTVMARLDAQYESELFALDENAIYALPFRFMAIPNGDSMIHVCMVDPVSYMSQFAAVSEDVKNKLNEAVSHFQSLIHSGFPDAYFDPQRSPEPLALPPANIEPIVTLGEINGTLETISTALEKGNFYYNNIAFKSGLDAFGDNDGTDDADDIFMLYQDPANRSQIEMRGFIAFKPTFFDLKGETSQVPNLSDTMVFLVENSLIHIYDYDRRQVYNVNGNTIYQLQIFDGYADPMLISSGVSHFAAVPVSVYLSESNGVVTVKMQNPIFKLLRYYSDVTPALMSTLQYDWNNAKSPNKVVWPDMTIEEFGDFSLNTAQKVFDAAMNAVSK